MGRTAIHGRCRLRHGGGGEQRYDADTVDLFAIGVIPAKAWYLIPATVFRSKPKMHIRFYPYGLPRRRRGRHDETHDYEHCREAWDLAAKE